MVMKKAGQGRRMELVIYLSMMGLELRNAEDALVQYNTWSTGPVANVLRMKVDSPHRPGLLPRGVNSNFCLVLSFCLFVPFLYPSHLCYVCVVLLLTLTLNVLQSSASYTTHH